MNTSNDLILLIVIPVILIAWAVGTFFLLRKILRHKSCAPISFGILLILGGGVFLFPGIEMMKQFADDEARAGAQVVFTDTPFFLGSPEAWLGIGALLIIGGIYIIYRSFKPSTK